MTYVPEEIYNKLKKLKESGISMSEFIRSLLAERLLLNIDSRPQYNSPPPPPIPKKKAKKKKEIVVNKDRAELMNELKKVLKKRKVE